MKELGIPKEEITVAMRPGALDILTLIPHGEVKTKGIAYVKSLLPETDKWNEFWKYFRGTWLTRYDIGDWNVHDVINAQNRTNNALERFNRTLNDLFSSAHPNLLNFVDTIRKQSFETFKTLNLIRLEKERPPQHAIGICKEIPEEYILFKYAKKFKK